VAAHELLHGLGFISSLRVTEEKNPKIGQAVNVDPGDRTKVYYTSSDGMYILDFFLSSNNGNPSSSSTENRPILFNSKRGPVQIFNPSVYKSGSSFSHLGGSLVNTDDTLMLPSVAAGKGREVALGNQVMAVMETIGWPTASNPKVPRIRIQSIPEDSKDEGNSNEGTSLSNKISLFMIPISIILIQ
jgi:hypothetical protein